MEVVLVPILAVVLIFVGVEAIRWVLRPEAKRLRAIKKINGRR